MISPVLLGDRPGPTAPASVVADRFDARKLRDHFERLAEADGGVDHFRGLIINLAIRGRLGTQDPNDAPADALLQLAARVLGGDRKRRSLDGRLEPEYRLPEGWRWCEPQDLGWITPRNDVPDDLPVGFVPMANVPTDYRRPVTYEGRPWKEIKKGYTHVADGDIAVAKITPCFQNGKSCVVKGLPNGLGAGTTELLVLRPVSGVAHPNYLLLFFKSPDFLARGVGLMTGTAGQQRVPVEYFASVPLPLPPLAEQKRIVAKVDQLMALCDDLEAKQNKKREIGIRLTKSALDAVTTAESPAEFDAAWKRVVDNFDALIDCADKVTSLRSALLELAVTSRLVAPVLGSALNARAAVEGGVDGSKPVPGLSNPSEWTEERGWLQIPLGAALSEPLANGRSVPDGGPAGFPVLRLSALRGRFLDFREQKRGAWTAEQAAPFVVRKDDVLFVRGNGAIRLVGRACIAGDTPEAVAFPDTAIRARLRPDVVDTKWLWYVWESGLVRRQVEASAKTTAGIFKVSQDVLYAVRIPVPTLVEQRRIVTKLEQIMEACDNLEAKLLRAEDRAARLVEAVVQELVA